LNIYVSTTTWPTYLKAGIAAEVNLLGNGTQTPVSAATNINKLIPMAANRITEENQLFDFVSYIR
jgi:hypothetical protein